MNYPVNIHSYLAGIWVVSLTQNILYGVSHDGVCHFCNISHVLDPDLSLQNYINCFKSSKLA